MTSHRPSVAMTTNSSMRPHGRNVVISGSAISTLRPGALSCTRDAARHTTITVDKERPGQA